MVSRFVLQKQIDAIKRVLATVIRSQNGILQQIANFNFFFRTMKSIHPSLSLSLPVLSISLVPRLDLFFTIANMHSAQRPAPISVSKNKIDIIESFPKTQNPRI
mmetsp:Transcript_27865/g.57757  ORF Transcript_27865/g.57757 Transcript_27865/m.57757 type:complete len:104 (+) Transcript_27865:1731-2042(+)